jgi:hypothetical protein
LPKRCHTEDYRPAPSRLSIWEDIYSALLPHVVSILQPTGFYGKHDIELRPASPNRLLESEERATIGAIATALTVAVNISHCTPPGVARAWLARIADQPALSGSGELPPEVHWAVVANYCRGSEPRGPHLQDVFGRRRVRFEAAARRPSARDLAKAARRALEAERRVRGRPPSVANRILAESLAQIFKSCGGQIIRRQVPVDVHGGGVLYVDGGPFLLFLERVIGPLRAHLRKHGLPDVTTETIERIACEQFK